MRIGFIGAGVMAEAIISGIIKSKTLPATDIMASDISKDRLNQLSNTYGINVANNNKDLIGFASIIFVAVKPQDVETVGQGVAQELSVGQTIVSIAAGVKISQLRENYPNIDIQVDGGINTETLQYCYDSGANIFVSGSTIFKSNDPQKKIQEFLA